jgi:hypothetical protein
LFIENTINIRHINLNRCRETVGDTKQMNSATNNPSLRALIIPTDAADHRLHRPDIDYVFRPALCNEPLVVVPAPVFAKNEDNPVARELDIDE